MLKKLRHDAAFTLLEMVIAVLIVSIMVAVVAPRLTGISQQAEETACAENQQTIRAALAEYHLQHHQYPAGNSAEQLQALVDDGLLQSVPKEPSGGTYNIQTTASGDEVVTCSVHGTLDADAG
jgi:prepilin-type N-terminal cleavage/methylation domain-containing protein